MRSNRNFGKQVNGAIVYAPMVLNDEHGLNTRPSAEDYARAGYKPVVDERPACDENHYAVATGWREADGRVERVYEVRVAESRPILISKAKVAALVDEMGKTAEFFAWLNSKAGYATRWFVAGDVVEYNPEDNASDLASLIAALGVEEANVAGYIAQCTAGGVA